MQNAAANPKPLSPAEQLGALIRQHRVARDIDLHEVSDRVGVKLSRLREFENGDSVPEPREWARLCNMVHRGLRMHTLEFRAARAARELQQYEDRLAELKRTVTSAEKRRADAADQLAKSVQAAVLS